MTIIKIIPSKTKNLGRATAAKRDKNIHFSMANNNPQVIYEKNFFERVVL